MLEHTDLNSSTGGDLWVYLLQPKGFKGLSKKDIGGFYYRELEKIYTDAFENGGMIHHGTLRILLAQGVDGCPIRFWPCGSEIIFTPHMSRAEAEMKTKGAQLVARCRCGMRTGLKCDQQELDALLLYLMLKQLAPIYPFANYVNCRHTWSLKYTPWLQKEGIPPDHKKAIRSLGVVSFSKNHMFEGVFVREGQEVHPDLAPGCSLLLIFEPSADHSTVWTF